MYYTVMKHNRHLRAQRKGRKQDPQIFFQSERVQGPIYIIAEYKT